MRDMAIKMMRAAETLLEALERTICWLVQTKAERYYWGQAEWNQAPKSVIDRQR